MRRHPFGIAITSLCDAYLLNAPTLFVAGLPASSRFPNTILSLQWLPVAYRMCYQICPLIYAAHHAIIPTYVTETAKPTRISTLPGCGRIRSDMSITRTKFGERFLCGRSVRMKRSANRVLKRHRIFCVQLFHRNTHKLRFCQYKRFGHSTVDQKYICQSSKAIVKSMSSLFSQISNHWRGGVYYGLAVDTTRTWFMFFVSDFNSIVFSAGAIHYSNFR